jgi:predicted permease
VSTLLQDLRFASRVLRRNPGFTVVAVLSLALGIGANTALFSLLDALLWKTLPVENPRQLVVLAEGEISAFTYPMFDTLRGNAKSLAAAAVMRMFREQEIVERGAKVKADLHIVSGEYFDILGVRAWRGRTIQAGDAKSPDGAVAVISQPFWERHYGRSPMAIGAHFQYGPRDFTVVGIAPPGFTGANLDFPADIWLPLEQTMSGDRVFWTRARALEVFARLAPGASPDRAAAEARGLLKRGVTLTPADTGFSRLRGRFSRPLLVLESVAGLVLLIACANLANLLMAGASARQREIAVRQAIGAGRARLVRQLLSESLLLAVASGCLAIGIAWKLNGALLHFLPPEAARAMANLSFHPDGRLIAFSGVATLSACVLFGLAPAWRATRQSFLAGIKETPGAGRSGKWTSRVLALGEVALCTLLLVTAGLFVSSLRNLRNFNTGFVADQVAVASIAAPHAYLTTQYVERFDELRRRAVELPGIAAAGFSQIGQLSGYSIADRILSPPDSLNTKDRSIEYQRVSPEFFAAMGTPLLRGRDFTVRDDASAPRVVIVNESFARRFFPGSDPMGKRIAASSWKGQSAEVVGVVKDSKWLNLRDAASPMFYEPFMQDPASQMVFALRGQGGAVSLAASLVQLARGVDPAFQVTDAVPFTEVEDRALATERLVAQVSTAFGALALLVACVGIYGILAYGVARRTREIGLRLALGATSGGVLWMVLRESLALTGLGFGVGIPAAVAGSRLIRSMLYGLTPTDPAIIAAAFFILIATSTAAAYIPARRAASVDPMIALRYE